MSSLTEKVLETAAGTTQSFAPLQSICAALNGFHNYANDLTRTVETTHFCAHPQKDLRQCLLYDSNEKDARLIGVEYMIPIARFKSLPEEEKKYWHSHFNEVQSGLLIMPKPVGLPSSVWDAAETKEMEELVNWVGKTYHFWQVDRGDELPYGAPQLMMSVTQDSQMSSSKVQERDSKYGVDSAYKKELRKDIALPPTPDGIDSAHHQ
ncbi:hypothetical protein CBS101457_003317 [Exobasidium rhododendri]|nr:hypothetical protein CBS101457_003317 [Exobasidium rhododendri]